jgi:prolyl oligopeptidase
MSSKYPYTKEEPLVEKIHGHDVEDPYRWLEDTKNPEVQDWIKAQKEFADSIINQYEGKEAISERLRELFDYDVIIPERFAVSKTNHGIRYFYELRKAGESQPVLYYQDGDDGERVELLNPVKLSPDGLIAIDWFSPSPDGVLVVYGISEGGTERSVLHIINVESGELLSEKIPQTRHSSIVWFPDNSGFYYTRNPLLGEVPKEEEDYYKHVFFHKIGSDYKNDIKVFGEGRDPAEIPGLYTNADCSYLVYNGYRFTETDIYVARVNKENPSELDFKTVVESRDIVNMPMIVEDTLYLVTQADAPNGRVLEYSIEDVLEKGEQAQARELIKESTGVISIQYERFTVFDKFIAIAEDENAHSKLKIYDRYSGELVNTIEFTSYSSVLGITSHHDIPRVYYMTETFFSPPTVFYYEDKEKQAMFYRPNLDLDESDFEAKQVWYESKDGTRVSMYVLSKADSEISSTTPVILTGYGGFGISNTPAYNQTHIVWNENGGVYAVSNLRGGAEYGHEWHMAGNRDKKQNVFDDFISAAEWLIGQGFGSRATLGILGGSNGGLLVGATLVQRPDLFCSVYCAVPLLDMLRYTRFLIAKYWIPEYGDPSKEEEFKWLYSYSPYHHVKAKTKYPPTYFYTAEGDSRVDPMHALKMAAKVQALTTGAIDTNPIILWVETSAGHGVGMPVEKVIETRTRFLMFLAHHSGIRFNS